MAPGPLPHGPVVILQVVKQRREDLLLVPKLCLGTLAWKLCFAKRSFGGAVPKQSLGTRSSTEQVLSPVFDGGEKKEAQRSHASSLWGNGRRNGRLRGCRCGRLAVPEHPPRPLLRSGNLRPTNGPGQLTGNARCKRGTGATRPVPVLA